MIQRLLAYWLGHKPLVVLRTHQVVEPDALLDAAQRLAGRIASASPSAVSATLALLRQRLPWEELAAAAAGEAALQARFFKQPDCREGVDSVKGKRPARFGALALPADGGET